MGDLKPKQFWRTALLWAAALGSISIAGFAAGRGAGGLAVVTGLVGIALAAAAFVAFRAEAASAVGPEDSPPRRHRRLAPSAIRPRVATGLVTGVVFAVALQFLGGEDRRSLAGGVTQAVVLGVAYTTILLWQAWAPAPEGTPPGPDQPPPPDPTTRREAP
jgi:hypothetical protein